jgi:hypothetical protein
MNDKPEALSSFHSQWSSTRPSELHEELPQAPRREPQAPHPRRKPQLPALTAEGHVWLAGMPPRFQPRATASRHPHIVNRLSQIWRSPLELQGYLGELMLSERTGREGFSFEVLCELADLQTLVEEMRGQTRF